MLGRFGREQLDDFEDLYVNIMVLSIDFISTSAVNCPADWVRIATQ